MDMANKVQICNLALARIGAARITSLSDSTSTANLCNTLYDDIAEEVMVEGPWTSTISRVALNKTTNTPAFGFTSEFEMPTVPRLLRVLSINEVVEGTDEFRIEGDKLLANIATVSVRYIGFVADTANYGVSLKKCIVSRLASEMAFTLTGSTALASRLYDRYLKDLDDGLAANGQQGSSNYIQTPDLIWIR
jgi:hypothetical protein